MLSGREEISDGEMVYELVELQRSLIQPAVLMADAARSLLGRPQNPLAGTLPLVLVVNPRNIGDQTPAHAEDADGIPWS